MSTAAVKPGPLKSCQFRPVPSIANRNRFKGLMSSIDAANQQIIERQMGGEETGHGAGRLRNFDMPGGLAPHIEDDGLKAFHQTESRYERWLPIRGDG